MIRAVTDLREGPESRVRYEYRKVAVQGGVPLFSEPLRVRSDVRRHRDEWLMALLADTLWHAVRAHRRTVR